MFDGIIFDVDGTLWDACDSVIEGWNQASIELTGHAIAMPADELKQLFGRTMKELCIALFPTVPAQKAMELGEECFRREIQYLREHPGRIYDGVLEMIQELSRTYPLFIVSNCQFGYIEIMLSTGKLTSYFSDYMCYEDTKAPKSVTIRELMKRNHLHNVLYIGDTQGDADACRDAEIPFLFVEYGLGTVQGDYPHAPSVSSIPRMVHALDLAHENR